MRRNFISWGVFAAFVVGAFILNWRESHLEFSGPIGTAKAVVWLIFLGFVGYSVYCSAHENIFRSIRTIAQLHWGRQIGIDLYLGLVLSLSVVYLHEGGLSVVLWLLPVLLFANLATILYIIIHFESLLAHFAS